MKARYDARSAGIEHSSWKRKAIMGERKNVQNEKGQCRRKGMARAAKMEI